MEHNAIDRVDEIVDWQLADGPAAQIEQARLADEFAGRQASMFMPVTAWDEFWCATIGFGL